MSIDVLRSLQYRNVRLTESPQLKQFGEMKEYFLSIPNDDMLVGFRRRAGLPHPGRELGGWYSNDSSYDVHNWDEIFNAFGQWLGAFAKIYAACGDKKVLEKLKYLLNEWGKTIEDDGYFYYSRSVNATHYVYEKFVGGLVDVYVYANLPEALDYLKRISVWAEKNLVRTRLAPSLYFATGGSPESFCQDNEWYTLTENLLRAYEATGDIFYRDFSQVWQYDSFWGELREGNFEAATGLHAYSHVNSLCGAAMVYRVSGNDSYLKTILNGYAMMKRHQRFASGGFSPQEKLRNTRGELYDAIQHTPESFEVACGSWAVFKLTNYLITTTGDGSYGEWAEAILYNGIGANLPMKDDNIRRGKTFYHADYRPGGGCKVYHENSYPCCSGTYPQAVTAYHEILYFLGGDGRTLCVSQYVPSVFTWDDKQVTLSQRGEYPRCNMMKLVVECAADTSFALKLRIPEWAGKAGMHIAVNAVPLEASVSDGWMVLDRIWENGDTVSLKWDMILRYVPILPDRTQRGAFMSGPVLLVMPGRERVYFTHEQTINPSLVFTRQGDPLHYSGPDGRELIPFYEIGEKEWYFSYFDVK